MGRLRLETTAGVAREGLAVVPRVSGVGHAPVEAAAALAESCLSGGTGLHTVVGVFRVGVRGVGLVVSRGVRVRRGASGRA